MTGGPPLPPKHAGCKVQGARLAARKRMQEGLCCAMRSDQRAVSCLNLATLGLCGPGVEKAFGCCGQAGINVGFGFRRPNSLAQGRYGGAHAAF